MLMPDFLLTIQIGASQISEKYPNNTYIDGIILLGGCPFCPHEFEQEALEFQTIRTYDGDSLQFSIKTHRCRHEDLPVEGEIFDKNYGCLVIRATDQYIYPPSAGKITFPPPHPSNIPNFRMLFRRIIRLTDKIEVAKRLDK